MCFLYFSKTPNGRKEATAQGRTLEARESRVQSQQQQLHREFDTSLSYKISYLKGEEDEKEGGRGREERKERERKRGREARSYILDKM